MPGSFEAVKGVTLTPLRRIKTFGGDVFHALKASAPGFSGFGEAYFSSVDQGIIKGWKKHTRMTLNLVVPYGEVRIIVYDEATGKRSICNLTPDRPDAYARLTVSPGLWMAFGGVGARLNLLLNIADIEHDPMEAESCPTASFEWTWD